jgi:hypothetical protein
MKLRQSAYKLQLHTSDRVHVAMKDVTESLTSFCASSQITVRNYSDKHITIKLIKSKRKKSQLEAGECVYICEVGSWVALYMSHCNLPNDLPNRRHKPILYRTAEQQFNQHMKQNLYGYWSQEKWEFFVAICKVSWRFIFT